MTPWKLKFFRLFLILIFLTSVDIGFIWAYSCPLVAVLLGGCDGGKSGDSSDTGSLVESDFCVPISLNQRHIISDSQFEIIEEACNWYAVEGQADSLPKDDDIPESCLSAWDGVLPLDSSFKGSEGALAQKVIIKAMRILLFYPLEIDSELSFLDVSNEVCPYYKDEIFAARSEPYQETISEFQYFTNRTPVRYILERIKNFSYDPSLVGSYALESEGVIKVGEYFGRGTGLTGPAAAGILLHEARHVDAPEDDGAPHADCVDEGLEGERTCDENLTGANGLEIIFYDALIRGSMKVSGELSSGEDESILSLERIYPLVWEMCATVTAKINDPSSDVALIFFPYENCLTDLFQDKSATEEFLEIYYGYSP